MGITAGLAVLWALWLAAAGVDTVRVTCPDWWRRNVVDDFDNLWD